MPSKLHACAYKNNRPSRPSFHSLNAGELFKKGPSVPDLVPCTPKGVMELLKATGVNPSGKLAVVLGRSNLVGRPAAELLLRADATVTVCHSKTPNLAAVCRTADILVVAVGHAELVQPDWVKPGAVVIDCGINPIPGACRD